ncbi:uncharacterized protein A4U43_C03F4090 [Asparagus officinalis]|uniref:Uncharacterized protein n=1 Tax=Asparagus officinalis TaxID=4686 RepID=A0A5P1F772_ASPOF|nr:uncharacterized protein A4U43_C03F4090 [Asparagus officinalis]
MVQDAKRRTIDRCSACLSHGFDKEALEIELSYLTLGVSDWRRLGVYDVDYGWGAPMHIMAHRRDLDSPVGVCEILWSPVFEGGVRLWTHSVWKKHLSKGRSGGTEPKEVSDSAANGCKAAAATGIKASGRRIGSTGRQLDFIGKERRWLAFGGHVDKEREAA